MKAGQIVAPGKVELVDIDLPDISSQPDGSLIIKNHYGSVCGSDIPYFAKRLDSDFPLVPGLSLHECIGFVIESKSKRFKEGDEVLSVPKFHHRALSEYFLSDENNTALLPEFDKKDQLLMAQPFGTIICACRKLGNLLNLDTVVVGQGTIGLFFTHILSNLGAKRIIGIDLFDYRLEASKKMKATHTVNSAKENSVEAIREITNGKMADLVVEAVGHQIETLNHCIELVKKEGTILAFGVPDEKIYNFQFDKFFNRNIKLVTSVGPDAQIDYTLAMDMIMQGRIDVTSVITHHLPFTQIQKAYELALNKTDGAIKIILEF